MPRSRLTIWPTVEQRQWVERHSKERGLPLTTVVQLALEQAMAAEQQGPHAHRLNPNRYDEETNPDGIGAVAGGPAPRSHGRLVDP